MRFFPTAQVLLLGQVSHAQPLPGEREGAGPAPCAHHVAGPVPTGHLAGKGCECLTSDVESSLHHSMGLLELGCLPCTLVPRRCCR